MPQFDPDKYLKSDSKPSGFDPDKYLGIESVEKKNPIQNGQKTGSQPLKLGLERFQAQAPTEAPPVLTEQGKIGYEQEVQKKSQQKQNLSEQLKSAKDVYYQAQGEKSSFSLYDGYQSSIKNIDDEISKNYPDEATVSRTVSGQEDFQKYKAKRDQLVSDREKLNQLSKETLQYINPRIESKIGSDLKENGLDKFTRVVGKFKVPDEFKIDDYSKKVAQESGLSDDGTFKKLVYDKLKSSIEFKISEPEIKKEFDKLYKSKTGLTPDEAIQKDFLNNFVEGKKIQSNLILQVESLNKEIKTKIDESAKSLSLEYKPILDSINIDYKNQTDEIKSKIEQLNQSYKSGLISRQDYELAFANTKGQFDLADQQYRQLFDSESKKYLNSQNEIFSKYNKRFNRQVSEFKSMADQQMSDAASKYGKSYEMSPEIKNQYESLWGQATKNYLSKEEAVKYQLDRSSLINNIGGQFTKNLFIGIGGGIKSISSMYDFDAGYVLGDYMENSFTSSSPEIKSGWDLLDPIKLQASTGRMIGGMTPILGASALTAAATKSAPTALRLLTTGLSNYLIETAQIGGGVKDQVFKKTGNVADANKAAKKVMDGNLYLLPLYALDGLPFLGNVTLGIKNTFLRAGAKAGIEALTETPQEYFQGIFEELAVSDKPISDTFKSMTLERLEDTALNVVPTSVLLGGGGTAIQGFRENISKFQGRSLAAKVDLADLTETTKKQFIYDTVLRRGDIFSKAYVSSLFNSGNINEQEMESFSKMIDDSANIMAESKKIGLNKAQSKVYAALRFDYLQSKNEFDLEQDEVSKKVYKAKMDSAEKSLNTYLSGGKPDAVVLTLPNNEQYIYSFETLNSIINEGGEILNQIVSGEVSIGLLSDKKNPKAKELSDKLTKLKQDAIQKQTAGQVPVQPGAPVSEEVEQGKPEAKPKVVTEEGVKAEEVTPEQYVQDLQDTKKSNPEEYWSVDDVSVDDAKKGTIIKEDGGYGLVSKTGDIKGVFKGLASKAKNVADKILKKAVQAGGTKLDNFDTYLTKIYERNGFKVVSRIPFNEEYAPPGWNKEKHGTPDVVAMVYDPDNKLNIKEKSFTDYDKAIAYRDKYANKVKKAYPVKEEVSKIDSEAVELEKIFANIVAPSTKNKGVSVTNKSSIDEIKAKTKDANRIKIIESAQKLLKTLRSILPNFDIVLHDNEGSYNASMSEVGGRAGSAGNFFVKNEDGSYSGRIDINLDKANLRTVAHEVAHGIMLKSFGDNPPLFKNFRDKISKVLSESSNKALMDFANQYKGDVAYEEYLVELTAALSEQEGKLSPNSLQKIAAIINDIVSRITKGAFKPFEDIKNTKDLIDFFNSISESISKGEGVSLDNFNQLGVSGVVSVSGEVKSKSSISAGEIKRFPVNPNTKLSEDVSLSDFDGKTLNLMESDRMTGGYIANDEGQPMFKFYGGVFFPVITGKWWASRNIVKARGIAENANKNRDSDGYVYSSPMIGADNQHMSNSDMLSTVIELMKYDVKNKKSKVTIADMVDSLKNAFNRKGTQSKSSVVKFVIKNSKNINELFNNLESVMFQDGKFILDSNGKEFLDELGKPLPNFTFEERKQIVETLLGNPRVKEARFPSAGSVTEAAKRFEEPITSKATRIGDLVTVMRTKGELKYKVTDKSDPFYHNSYPVEIYSENKDGSPSEIEVYVLDGAYSMGDVLPSLTKSSGGQFTYEEYYKKHSVKSQKTVDAQYNRTAKLSSASGKVTASAQASKSQLNSPDSISQLVSQARSNGISDSSIEAFLKGKGFNTSDINAAMGKSIESSELNESNVENAIELVDDINENKRKAERASSKRKAELEKKIAEAEAELDKISNEAQIVKVINDNFDKIKKDLKEQGLLKVKC